MPAPPKPPAFYVRRIAPAFDLDVGAVLAVMRGEGGNRWGAIGDAGTSHGPFQLRRGGALPANRSPAWANSPAGIKYALRTMANAGARGLTGKAAINSIVRDFERPADPDSSVRNAVARYQPVASVGAGSRPARTSTVLPPKTKPSRELRQAQQAVMSALALAVGGGDPSQAWHALLTGMDAMARIKPPKLTKAQGGQYSAQTTAGGLVAPLTTPMKGGSEFRVSDPEGMPGQGGRYHGGKDWFAPAGSPVLAPTAGRIVEVRASQGNKGQIFGGVVKIEGADGRVYVFRHVDPKSVKVGQRVKAGQPVATVTDWQSGSSHSHVEVWRTLGGGYALDNALDPVEIFS